MDREIIHLNITDFAVAVERICDSSLQGLPLIVASTSAPAKCSLVFDMSEEAYQDGVRKGMAIHHARKFCGRARIIDPHPRLYRRAMAALVKQVMHYSPLVEPGLEDGHLFMDVTGTHRLFGPAPDIALRLRKELRQGLGLDPVWSLASSKLVAKVASRMVRPHGEYIVAPGEEDAFLAPLPLSLLPGISRAEMAIMADFNVRCVGELAGLSHRQLMLPFKKRASYLHDISRGRDGAAVSPGKKKKVQLMVRHVFAEETISHTDLSAAIGSLVQQVGQQLRQGGLLGQRLWLSLHYADGRSLRRQAIHKGGSDNDFVLRALALGALERSRQHRVRVRSCSLVCDRLLPRSRQQTLFTMQSHREQRQGKILAAMDLVCSRFGESSIRLGAGL